VNSQKRKILFTLATAIMLPALLVTGAAPANAAARFTTVSSSATVSGLNVSVAAVVKATQKVTTQNYGVCVRDSSNRNLDFASQQKIAITTTGTATKASKSFSPGTYTYFPCVQYQNVWWEGTKKQFTVKAPTTSVSTTMPVGDLPNWKQNFKEDFTKNAGLGQIDEVYGASMRGYDGFNDTSGNGTYAPDKVLTASNGMLNYNLHTENGRPLVATPVLNDYKGQTYGRYSIRFRSDTLVGYKIAFMQWPSSDNWNEGEIDWPEGNLDGHMRPGLAVPGTLTSSGMNFEPAQEIFSKTNATNWHVATTEWTPSGIKWYWDGELVNYTTKSPSTNFRWTLQAETETWNARIPDPSLKGNLQVDWATSYTYVP
jgi:hypothetical protein